jgi:hypothetical protein
LLFHLNWLPHVEFQASSPYPSATWELIQYTKTACWSSDKNSASAKFPICWHLWTTNLTPSWNSSQIFNLRHALPPMQQPPYMCLDVSPRINMLQLQIWVQNLLKLLGKKILQSLFGASIRVKHWGTQMQWSPRRADDSQVSQVGGSRQCVRMTNAMITRYGRLSTKLATSAQLVPVNIRFPVRDRSESPYFLQQPTFHRDMVLILCKDWGNTRFVHCMSFIHEGESQ